MKIVDVRTAVVTRRYDGSLRNTRHAWAGKHYVLVSVDASDGTSGIGEVYCDGEGAPNVMQAIVRDEIRPHLLGQDPRAIERIRAVLNDRFVLNGRMGASRIGMAGIDIALWDLMGKLTGQPVHRLLGGYGDRASVYGSGGMYGPGLTPDRLAKSMGEAVASGLGGIKIKGAGAGLDEDVARVAAVREAIGPARLMVDAMFAPDVPGAIRLARALESFGLHFLEAPTSAGDRRGWKAVADAVAIPLAGPELEGSPDVMLDFVLSGAVHFLQFDVVLAGGLSQGRDLAALARAFHRPVTLHCAASAVGLAASAQLAAAVPNCDSLEFHLMHQGLHEHLWESGWRLETGSLVIPDRPGLGIDLDLDGLLRLEQAA